jgi:hypothetical protein
MRIHSALFFVGVVLLPLTVLCQVPITGRVIDSQTVEPIPFANVFIVNTSQGATTDMEGSFTFLSDDYGAAEIAISFVGYDTYKKRLTFTGEAIDLGTIKLKSSNTQLDEVVIKSSRDEAWEKDLKKFKKIFLGDDQFAEECIIENPWVIDLKSEESSHLLFGRSLAPIIISNRALGYRVSFSLRKFTSNPTTYSIEGDSYFSPLEPSSVKELDKWNTNREATYHRSLNNLLRSMVTRSMYSQGFIIYNELPFQAGKFTRHQRFIENVGKYIELADTTGMVKSLGKDKFLISFSNRLEVHNRFDRSKDKVYQDIPYQVSWLTLKSNSIVVNGNGIPEKPADIIVLGSMGNDRVARMMPFDFTPKVARNKKREKQILAALPYFYEQIYVHTDRPYYYAGEGLWFKGYVNYATPAFRDSLSKTVYVDLISPSKNILVSKVLRIDSGRFSGQFDIPIGTDAGMYSFRAYTNLQRNFGDSTLFAKPVPIVALQDMVAKIPARPISDEHVTITSNKDNFKSREKIELTVKLVDDEGKPMKGDLSMSVTDIRQVSPVSIAGDIKELFPLKDPPPIDAKIAKAPFTVEAGITMSGRFRNSNKKPERADLNVIQISPKRVVFTASDNDGYFKVTDLIIYDSARYSITASDKKGVSYGSAEILENPKPAIVFKKPTDSLKVIKVNFAQRDKTTISKGGESVTMLDEIEIRGKRIQEEYKPEFRVKRPYGKSSYVLDEKDLTGPGRTYPTVILMIQNRFPGLVVRQAAAQGEDVHWVVYLKRNEYGSINNIKEVAITVNDVFLGGATPEQILMSLNPNAIKSIELQTSLNVLYGINSNQGILKIYLKDGQDIDLTRTPIGTVKMLGYNSSPAFPSPDYENETYALPDFRSLIYWSLTLPFSNDGTAVVSFFSADLTTTYRIEVEGVTAEGKPVHIVKTIEVGE